MTHSRRFWFLLRLLRKRSSALLVALAVVAGGACEQRVSTRPDRTGLVARDRQDRSRFDFRLLSSNLADTPSWGAAWNDVDDDGYPELLVGRHKRHAWFLDNQSGALVKRQTAALLQLPPGKKYYDRHNCAWGEANLDGKPDVFCVSGAESGTGLGPNQLLISSSGDLVADTPAALLDPPSRGRSVNWIDFDGDGDLDLFVGSEVRRGSPNRIFVRTARGYVPKRVGVESEMATVSSSAADWDSDGDPDLVALGHGYVGSRAYENLGGAYREVFHRAITGKEWTAASWADFDRDMDLDLLLTRTSMLAVAVNEAGRFRIETKFPLKAGRVGLWLDVENDGDSDIFVVQGRPGAPPLDDPPAPGSPDAPDLLITNNRGELSLTDRFAPAGAVSANGESAAVSDFDRDGRLDLVVTNGYLDARGPVFLATNLSKSENWAALDLEHTKANPAGYGAVVRVRGPGARLVPVTDGVVFHSQSETGHLIVGLGELDFVRVEVVWPDGGRDCVRLDHEETVELRYGDARC